MTIWKDMGKVVVTCLKYYTSISLEGLQKAMSYLR